ncbi:MAG: hypothetical protein WBP79_00180 [Candidatus Acidiferrales bacterium]
MPRTNSRKRARRSRGKTARFNFAVAVARIAEKPVRGVKLKTVSAFTMLVAVLCLLAFMAGRVDLAAMNQPATVGKTHSPAARNTNAHKRAVSGEGKISESRRPIHLASF